MWQEFINIPYKRQLLEKGMSIFMQWYYIKNQAFSLYEYETDSEKITQEIMKRLKIKYSEHPLFSISNKQLWYWKRNNIDETAWNYSHSRQILDIFCEVSQLNLHKIKYYESNILQENVHI
jgi:hypothetical protein